MFGESRRQDMHTGRGGWHITKTSDSLGGCSLNRDRVGRIFCKQLDLSARYDSRLRINNLDREVGSRSRDGKKNDGRKNYREKPAEPHALLLYSRKGLVLSVRAGLLACE